MAYSDHDLVEVFRETVRIAHLDRRSATGLPLSP
jgi:hypothetical protein